MASRCDPTARARSAAFATTVSMSSPIPRIRRTGRRSSNVTRMSPYPAQSSLSPSSADLLGSSRHVSPVRQHDALRNADEHVFVLPSRHGLGT